MAQVLQGVWIVFMLSPTRQSSGTVKSAQPLTFTLALNRKEARMRMFKKIAWVVLAGALMSFPASLYLSSKLVAPLWYVVLSSFMQALGIGLFAIFFGVIALVARRNSEKGGMKTALILMAVVSTFTSYAVISASLRV